MLRGKKILIGVTGSIAAYKMATLIRFLVKTGAEVKVIMTESAKTFITPLTLSTLSKHPVHTSFVKNETGEWTNHVELALWADAMLIAPLSANTLGKMANGICDNLLIATYLSAKCPVAVAPAMDLDMYRHPTTLLNLEKLRSFGNIIIDAENGELASGLSGVGRMAEPETLFKNLETLLHKKTDFFGKSILITSGPTHEAIDPVRFIGNHSTGKMGRSIAEELANRGAMVEFISGPVAHYPSHTNIRIHKVTSANQMYDSVKSLFPGCDISIFTAAVADFKPETVATSKIKRNGANLNINLVPNPDIASEIGKLKTKKQFTVGFALETDKEEQNALKKLESKNLDLIVLNSLNHQGAGFAHDTNKVSIFDRKNKAVHFELKTKTEVAKDLADVILSHLQS